MQIHPSTKKLIDRLYDMTLERKIAWKQGDDGAVVFDTERYRVSLVGSPTEVILSSDAGAELDKADHQELLNTLLDDGTSYADYVNQLHKEAHRIARGAETAIDDVLAELDNAEVIPELVEEEAEKPLDPVFSHKPETPEEALSEPSLEDLSSEQVADAVASLAKDVNAAEARAEVVEEAAPEIEAAPAPEEPVDEVQAETPKEVPVPEVPEAEPEIVEAAAPEAPPEPPEVKAPESPEEPIAEAAPEPAEPVVEPPLPPLPNPTFAPAPGNPAPTQNARSNVLMGGTLGSGFGQPFSRPPQPAAPPIPPVPPAPVEEKSAEAAPEASTPPPPPPTPPSPPPVSTGGYNPSRNFSTFPISGPPIKPLVDPPVPPLTPPVEQASAPTEPPPLPPVLAPEDAPGVSEEGIADAIGAISETVDDDIDPPAEFEENLGTAVSGLAQRATDDANAAADAGAEAAESLKEKSIGVVDETGDMTPLTIEPEAPPPVAEEIAVAEAPPEPPAETPEEPPKPPSKRFNPWR